MEHETEIILTSFWVPWIWECSCGESSGYYFKKYKALLEAKGHREELDAVQEAELDQDNERIYFYDDE